MKFKKFFSSCSPNVNRKRLEEESKYANLRPLYKQHTSVPDFVNVGQNDGCSSSSNVSGGVGTSKLSTYGHNNNNNGLIESGSKSAIKSSKLHPNRLKQSTSQFYIKSADEFLERRAEDHSCKENGEWRDTEQQGKETAPNGGLKVGDRIIWAREETGHWEGGIVKWLGEIEGEPIAGIEFDYPLQLGSGWYQNRKLFECAKHHGGLVAVAGLMLESDFTNSEPASKSNTSQISKASSMANTSLFGDENAEQTSHGSPNMDFGPVPSRHDQTTVAISSAFNRFDTAAGTSGYNSQASTSFGLTSLLSKSVSMSRVPFVQAPLKEEDAERLSGSSKGVQGNRNSCYLDATLFSMFAFTSAFDTILMRPFADDLGTKIQCILREDIVNKLRKDLFVPAEHVMDIRKMMEHLDEKMTNAEMDPAEFLQYLFKEIMKLSEFIKLSSNESDFFHQVLVQPSEGDQSRIPSVQQLFEKSLLMQQLKLKEVPNPALILQMPRSGNSYKTYAGIYPNLSIDITDLLENTPRMCIICGTLATWECQDCYGRFCNEAQGSVSYAESTAFCNTCAEVTHKKTVELMQHKSKWKKIEYNEDVLRYVNQQPLISFHPVQTSYEDNQDYNRYLQHIPRVKMDLVAVICIETSHFVSFVKCGTDRCAPWAFFDSMADRVENTNGGGHNIPQVKLLPRFGEWLNSLEENMDNISKDFNSYTTELKRFLSDAYICIYCSPEANMFR